MLRLNKRDRLVIVWQPGGTSSNSGKRLCTSPEGSGRLSPPHGKGGDSRSQDH